MPDLSNLWQRFVLAFMLLFGLAVGIAATIFGYSNTGSVTVGFAVWHLGAIPLWSVAIVPLALALVVGTLYHWWNSLHHFSEHMRHRHRVRDLESEVTALKEQLDKLLEMPDQAAAAPPAAKPAGAKQDLEPAKAGAAEPSALPTANSGANGSKRPAARKRGSTAAAGKPSPEAGDGSAESEKAPTSAEAANSES